MPIFEYRCDNCNKKFTHLCGKMVATTLPVCPECKSEKITKLFSTFAFRRSMESELEDLADPSKLGDIEDPKQVRKWAEKLGKRFGDEMGEDFKESLDQLEDEMYKEKSSKNEETSIE